MSRCKSDWPSSSTASRKRDSTCRSVLNGFERNARPTQPEIQPRLNKRLQESGVAYQLPPATRNALKRVAGHGPRLDRQPSPVSCAGGVFCRSWRRLPCALQVVREGLRGQALCWLFSALRGSPGITDLWLLGRNSIQTTLGLSAPNFSIPSLFASVYYMYHPCLKLEPRSWKLELIHC